MTSFRHTAAFGMVVTTALFVSSAQAQTETLRGAEVTQASSVAHLPSLRGAMANLEGTGAEHRVIRELRIPLVDAPGNASDPVVQKTITTATAAAVGLGFAGVGQGDYGFSVQYAPPDTTGAVGATQYVQWVNVNLAVFDKATHALEKLVAGNEVFQPLGGACATNNDGDPIVQYDKQAGRWVLTQFSVTNGATLGYWQCVAVSQTSDALGAYNLYAFPQKYFNDYPKMSVWPDGYYVTYNMFRGNTFMGAATCVMDRANMLAGAAAAQQCFQLSSSYASLLAADLDGSVAPPLGTPNYLVNRLSSALGFWKFHVDWSNPGASTLSGPTTIPVAAYNAACSGGTCIPQPGTSQKLDSLADRLMWRLAYRVVNGEELMVVNHAVSVPVSGSGRKASSTAGIRWYQLKIANGSPSIVQQATYSPDATYRWMGSIAMDKLGNIALGYSQSSGTVKPGLAIATRQFGDPANTLGAEQVVKTGGGSQLPNLSRWGDYTHMSVDPQDDCTFWHTGQYLKSDGTFNWSTWITSFKLPNCS